ncbi:MAG: MFS transporter, partial [Candidatus Limnocylindrales bacterium]
DLVGPSRRGFAMGLNEAAGYGAVALTAMVTGLIAANAGLRPGPVLRGLAFAGIGLGSSVLWVRETLPYARHEQHTVGPGGNLGWRDVFRQMTWRDRSLSADSQAGFVNNLNDGVAWGLLPVFYATRGLPIIEVAVLAAAYPAVWGVTQIGTGAVSDRIGRKGLIVAGMLIQAGAILIIAISSTFLIWLAAAVMLGVGTAMVYPTLLAAIGDVAHPAWRGSALGVYRMWRDLGFAAGAVLAGVLADAFGIRLAVGVVAALTALSGLVVLVRMRETHPRPPVTPRADAR